MSSPRPPQPSPQPTTTAPAEQSSSGRACPICNVSMENRDPYGHSMIHFPDSPIPIRPDTLAARKQQAQLLGREEPQE